MSDTPLDQIEMHAAQAQTRADDSDVRVHLREIRQLVAAAKADREKLIKAEVPVDE